MKKRILAALFALIIFFSLGMHSVFADTAACDPDDDSCNQNSANAAVPQPTSPVIPTGANINTQTTGNINSTPAASTNQTIPLLQNPLKVNSVTSLILSAVDLAIFIGTIIAVLMFIFIGFKFVLAQGDPTKLSEAKKWFLYAVIGTAVLISSKVIVQVIESTLISTGIVNQNVLPPQQ